MSRTKLGRPPSLSAEAIVKLVTCYFDCKNLIESSVKSFLSYYDRTYYLRGEVLSDECSEFILKLGNLEHISFPVVEGLNKLMHHLRSRRFKFLTPYPFFSTTGKDFLDCTCVTESGVAIRYHLRLLPFIPGELLDDVDKKYLTSALLSDIGEMVATTDKELKVSTFSSC